MIVNVRKFSAQSLKKINLGDYVFFASLITTVIVLLCIAILFQKITAQSNILKNLRTQLLTVKMSEQDKFLLQQSLDRTVSERDSLTKAFPKEEELLVFINIIDNLKSDTVKVIRFSVDSDVPTKIGNSPKFIPMTLILNGDLDEIVKDLDIIANSPFFIRPVFLNYEYNGKQVTVSTQFHLFVADDFQRNARKTI